MPSDSGSGERSRPAVGPQVTAQDGVRQTLGKYEIQKKIGSGGMGSVFLARDTELKRTVALKLLSKDKAQNPQLLRRFKAEAQAAAQLRHENIVAIYEAGELEGYPYIALEYVDGKDLHQYVTRRGPLPVRRSVEIVTQVARALQHAHERNVVHRDIKPSNLLIRRDGTVKLTDMGLARVVDETMETGITRAGTTVGTVDYMAPEQAKSSKAADIRSDIYSLGCAWYQMLTGKAPFHEGSVTNKLAAHATTPPPDPRDVNGEVPEAVVAVMQRMMAKRPDDRYQTPSELLEDLVSPHLTRKGVAADVLAALATDESEDGPASDGHSSSGGHADTRPGKGGVLPKERMGISLEAMKYLIVVGIVVGVLGLLYWISQNFGKVFDGGDQSAGGGGLTARSGEADERSRSASRGSAGGEVRPRQGGEVKPRTGGSEPTGVPVVGRGKEPPAAVENAAERITIGRPQEREHMPAWVADVMPAEPGAEKVAAAVARDPALSAPFGDIPAALRSLPPTGGVVELRGNGPFPLPPMSVAAGRRITLRAAAESKPVVLLSPGEGPNDALLRVAQGELVLAGIHLVLPSESFPGSDNLALVEAAGGDVVIRSCSVTQLGAREGNGRVAAVRTVKGLPGKSGGKARPARVLLHQTLLRGSDLIALDVRGDAAECVVCESLLASERGALFTAAGEGEAGGEGAAPARSVHFFSSASSTGGAAWQLKAAPGTRVVAMDSVFAAQNGSADAASALLSLAEWPAAGGTAGVTGLEVVTRSCLFAGWGRLAAPVELVGGEVTTAEQWQKLWNSPNVAVAVQGEKSPKPAGEVSSASPADLDPTVFVTSDLRGADGGPLGPRVAELVVPSSSVVARVAAARHRPNLAALPFANPMPARVINVDLGRQDLGALVSKEDWPNGTKIVATGSGNVKSSPLRFSGKSLRIEFEQKEGQPLVVETRSTDYRKAERAFITVEQGAIELVGGRFKVPASARGDVPLAFLQVTDGSFLIDDCYVAGPMTESPGHKGLVRWSQSSPAPASGGYSRFGVVRESYLADTMPVVSADLQGQALILRGSVAASLGDLVACRVAAGDSPGAGVVDVDRCTLSAGAAAFHVEAPTTGQGAALRYFVSNTVFAPPVDAGSEAGPPVVLRDRSGARDRRAIEWWDEANGVAPELTRLLDAPSLPASGSPEAVWQEAWGDGHVVRLLTGRDGVVMREPYPPRAKLAPTDFALRDTSRAAKWGDGGGPIGADIGRVASAETKPKSAPNRATGAPAPGTTGTKSNF